MKRIAFFLLVMPLLVWAQTSVTYTESSATLFNPERGLYKHTEVFSTGPYNFLNQSTLEGYRTSQNISLIVRVFYLDNFVTSDISNTFLNNIQTDFNTIRNAGVKVIVRFAYTNTPNGWPPASPYGDATKAQIIAHIQQLASVLSANSDVIATVQAGFIGIWGEWYYTTHLGDPAVSGHPDATDYANRKEIIDTYLAALPADRAIAIRTPLNKTKMLGITTSGYVTAATAFQNTALARLAHHNDCFLASETDYGTYVDSTNEKPYLNKETLYLPMGGETCNDDPTFTNCTNAVKELKRMHWSYLNRDYNTDIIDRWIDNNCYSDIVNGLGYRIVLQSGSYSSTIPQGENFSFTLTLKNVGWAPPFNARAVKVIARNVSNGQEYSFPLTADPRTWFPQQSITISESFDSGNIPEGNYKLFLHLSDPYNSLSSRSEYSLQTANVGTWEAATGYNDLQHTFIVSQPLGIITPSVLFTDKWEVERVHHVKIYNTLGVEVFSREGSRDEMEQELHTLYLMPGRYQMIVITGDTFYSQAIIK